ncbi:hypothetical protein JZ751_023493 [Albula glossodonta]|uniref:Uncharacterized protein n=1 Tax=Albula glossodonta TaxID=121402 RepID=A0A8T2NPR8_9TELE|nr:hypothetical protein JZ751_023493 [Albula glossodonta]
MISASELLGDPQTLFFKGSAELKCGVLGGKKKKDAHMWEQSHAVEEVRLLRTTTVTNNIHLPGNSKRNKKNIPLCSFKIGFMPGTSELELTAMNVWKLKGSAERV